MAAPEVPARGGKGGEMGLLQIRNRGVVQPPRRTLDCRRRLHGGLRLHATAMLQPTQMDRLLKPNAKMTTAHPSTPHTF